MKNNSKGITLTSLVIYIAVVFVVLAAIMRITMYFSSNIKDATDVSFETEFNKLNLYLLDESKKTGNEILEITDGIQITFSSGNKYTYNEEEQKVYLNDNIKVCENVESCLFEQKVAENGKKVLTLTITIASIEKEINYIMVTQSNNYEDQDIIAEDDYIIEKDTFKDSYQQVEYIESTGTQYIDTGIPQNEISEISGEIQFTNFGSSHQGICGRYTSDYTSINIVYNASSDILAFGWVGNNVYKIPADLNKHSFNMNLQSITIDNTVVSTYSSNQASDADTLVVFARRIDNSGSSITNLANLKLYKFQIKSNDKFVRDFIPCYRKSDNVVGLYDLVNEVFYTNAGTGEFIKGADV